MTSEDLRQKFLDYMKGKKHAILPSFPLVPENDPSILFTTAGMHPLVPYLMGEKHPLGKRLADVQKCLRTDDIEEIGDNQHLTFFEMLGYWSLGDYFKKESIEYTFGFYTEVLGIKKKDISVSVFKGDKDAPFDEESYNTWKDKIGIPEERIYKYDKKENWWGPVSETGPCGPCTEMFIDTGLPKCSEKCDPACDCDKFVEIGNNVFMEYFKDAEDKFEKLEQKNVDVGLGFERLVMFAQKKENVFETDLFTDIVAKIKALSLEENELSVRVIADHMRAACFILADGITPSNMDKGYILRRLIRRVIRHGRTLGITGGITVEIGKVVVDRYREIYPELEANAHLIVAELQAEEEKFQVTLDKGMTQFQKIAEGKDVISGEDAFDLFQTYGFPLEITVEIAEHKGKKVDKKGFEAEYKKHQDLSRKGAEGKFKGGLGDSSDMSVKYHTATHLLNESLRRVLGDHVSQKGSNITAERMRFDFSHGEKMTPDEIKKVEDLVNEKITEALPVVETVTSVEEAKKLGAIGVFDAKYEEKVKVYSIGGDLKSKSAFSKEICGGPHVENTSVLGKFKIQKEESSSSGVRRIKAVLT